MFDRIKKKWKKFRKRILNKLKEIDDFYTKHPEEYIEIERINRGFP